MDWTSTGDLEQPPSLFFRQIAGEGNLHFSAVDHPGPALTSGTIIRMNLRVCQSDVDRLERPMLALGIHPHGDAGADSERGEEKLVRVRPRISPSSVVRFISLEPVPTDRYVFEIRRVRRIDDNHSAQRSGLFTLSVQLHLVEGSGHSHVAISA